MKQLVFYALLCVILGIGGCGYTRDEQLCMDLVRLPQSSVPKGWTLSPPARVPPSEKWSWFRNNPLVLIGDDAKSISIGGKPTLAAKVFGTIYEEHDENEYSDQIGQIIGTLCFYYDDAAKARIEYEELKAETAAGKTRPHEAYVGYARERPNVVLFMYITSNSKGKDAFVSHFNAAATRK